jgi:hypothetical protein
MPTIGEHAKDGLDDPVYTHCLLISDSLNEHAPRLWNEKFHFSLAPAAEPGMAVENLARIEYILAECVVGQEPHLSAFLSREYVQTVLCAPSRAITA